jgi:hypothetical protein
VPACSSDPLRRRSPKGEDFQWLKSLAGDDSFVGSSNDPAEANATRPLWGLWVSSFFTKRTLCGVVPGVESLIDVTLGASPPELD